MDSAKGIFSYSVGKKIIMALTGLFLVVFLIEHLIGNSLMLVGEEAFNAYAHFMGTFPVVRILEVGLFAGIIFHIVDALLITRHNQSARPVGYAVSGGHANSSWFSRNMGVTGTIMFIFLVLHLGSFFLDARFGIDIRMAGEEGYYQGEYLNIFLKCKAHFSVWWYSAIYIVAMIIVGLHLNHGFQSAFQTLGMNHKKYTPLIKATGSLLAIVIPAGFMVIPIYFLVTA